jgi:regulator of protease activity HflC (stomatin/prohibitin superfamily)
LFVIPEGHWAIREICGKFQGILEPGVHAYVPYIYTTKDLSSWGPGANKKGYLIEQSEQQTNILGNCKTKDNAILTAQASITWRILDPKTTAYASSNLSSTITDLAISTLRNDVETLNFDEVFSSKNVLNEKIKNKLDEAIAQWGIELLQLEIQEIKRDSETESILTAISKTVADIVKDQETKAGNFKAKGETLLAFVNAQSEGMKFNSQEETYRLTVLTETFGEEAAQKILDEERKSYERSALQLEPLRKEGLQMLKEADKLENQTAIMQRLMLMSLLNTLDVEAAKRLLEVVTKIFNDITNIKKSS